MKPSKDFGEAVKLLRRITTKDFSLLIPRPGWQGVIGFLPFDL
jgi:hypothetical protein